MNNNLRDNFQGLQVSHPPSIQQLAAATPLTVPDFPPPFNSSQHQPILLPPPVQDNTVNVLELIISIKSQQQLELNE